MLFEIRNYHFEPQDFRAYKEWARTLAVPYLKSQLDVIGFWVNTDDDPEIRGEPDPLGSANVTWIIRWDTMAQRNEVLTKLLASAEWQEIFRQVPGGRENYHRLESKSTEAL